MRPKVLLKRFLDGNLQNVSFVDMQKLVNSLGFSSKTTSGSHHIYVHGDISELVNLQEVKGQAKPYQIRQVLRLIERYSLDIKD